MYLFFQLTVLCTFILCDFKCFGIIPRYYETVSDVLSSVKKMEDSLKRLKQARKTAFSSNSNNGGVSDDNKIRLQLALDVEYFANQVC